MSIFILEFNPNDNFETIYDGKVVEGCLRIKFVSKKEIYDPKKVEEIIDKIEIGSEARKEKYAKEARKALRDLNSAIDALETHFITNTLSFFKLGEDYIDTVKV